MKSRDELHFVDAVKEHFSFMCALGFECALAEDTFVQFESPQVKVNVYHGRRSYEIGLELVSASDDSESYSFSEVLRLWSKKEADQYKNFASHDVHGVAQGVRRLALSFQQRVSGGLFEDKELFNQLKSQRMKLCEEYALETQLLRARREAEEAWRSKDFMKVIELLDPFASHLSVAEKKKLHYAKSHL